MKSIETYILLMISLVCIWTISSCSPDEPVIKPTWGDEIDGPNTEEKKPVSKIDTIDIVDYTITTQDLVKGKMAQLVVRFNHPAYFVEVKDVNGYYDFNGINMSKDRKQMTLVMPFYSYGTDYQFQLTLCDSLMEHSWKRMVKFNSYEGNYLYEGVVQSTISDYDRETIWMATSFPDRLYRISMSDPENPTYVDFENCPNVMTINPYNGKLYVGSTINTYYQDEKYNRMMYVCDPVTLVKEDSFKISFNSDVYSGSIDASPMSIAFTDDGWGIVVRSKYSSNGTDLCYVDSKNGHKTRVDDCWDLFYGSVTTSYDKKSVILQKMDYAGHDLLFVNRKNDAAIKSFAVHGKFNSDEYWAGGRRMTSRFHRSQPLYLVQCVQSLCLMDYSQGTYSPVYIQEGRFNPCIEYDYNNPNHIIRFANNYVTNLDISTLKEKFVGRLAYNPKQIYHNPKRDQLIAVMPDPYGSSKTYITLYDMSSMREE